MEDWVIKKQNTMDIWSILVAITTNRCIEPKGFNNVRIDGTLQYRNVPCPTLIFQENVDERIIIHTTKAFHKNNLKLIFISIKGFNSHPKKDWNNK